MAVRDVRIVTCDRCKVTAEQEMLAVSSLPNGWQRGTFGDRTGDYCLVCSGIIEAAMKPLERTRWGSAEKE